MATNQDSTTAQLATVRECVYEIAQLAHIGPTSDDPCAIIRTIDRLANIADAALSGTDTDTEDDVVAEAPENPGAPLDPHAEDREKAAQNGLDCLLELEDRLRWATGTLNCVIFADHLEKPDSDAIDSAMRQLTDAQRVVERLYALKREP